MGVFPDGEAPGAIMDRIQNVRSGMEQNKIYELVREKIIWLDLKPESIINLSDLAESFEVSRTPIKEAMIYLQADGWVLRQGSHFMVTPLSLDRIREISEIRSLIEVQANIWAMSRATPEELLALDELEKETQQIDGTSGNKQLIELDVKFHHILFKMTKNSQLAQLLERMLGHYLRFWLAIPREIEPQSFFTEAQEIIHAVKAKDEARLREASVKHIKRSVDEIMGTF
jgi:DNA-binding GntR family transcriptional regulator